MKTCKFMVAAADGLQSGLHRIVYESDKEILRPESFFALPGSSYLAVADSGKNLYVAVSFSSRFYNDGEVASFALKSDGSVEWLNSFPSGGLSCCHVVARDRFAYSANYRGGTLAEYRLSADGRIERRSQLIRHRGRGADPERQADAHPHFVGFTPDGLFLTVIDLGCDGVFFYRYSAEKGIESRHYAFSPMPPGSGPRHLVFSSCGGKAYIANELASSVSVCDYEAGSLTVIETLSTLPENFQGENTVAAIRITPDGRTIYVSNRGHDSLAVYAVQKDGSLKLTGHLDAGGQGPRDFILLDDGSKLLVAHEKDTSIALIDMRAGKEKTAQLSFKFPEAKRPIGLLVLE